MKKFLSIILSITMLLAVGATSMVAMADIQSQESTTQQTKVTVKVNGTSSSDVTFDVDSKDPNKITFTYTGNGTVEGWTFDGMVEGTDYDIVGQTDNTITIELINDYDGDISADAIVKGASKTTTKKSNKNKSPDTGSMAAASIAVAGAGVAILAAVKKADAE